jgi:DNA-binding CsgD family transcriptional regulator
VVNTLFILINTMDFYRKDITQLKALLEKKAGLSKLCRSDARELKHLERLVAPFNYAVVLYDQNSSVPLFVSDRFFFWVVTGSCYNYSVTDLEALLKKCNNTVNLISFFSHFSAAGAGEMRNWWMLKTNKGKEFWLSSCSCLIHSGAIILSVYYNAEISPASEKTLFSDISVGLDMDDLEAKLLTLSERETEVYELAATGIKNQPACDELFISKGTYETHKKHVKTKLGISTDAGLARSYYSYRHHRSFTKK